MPVILQPDLFDAWLDPSNNDTEKLSTMLSPCASELMLAYQVSPAINRGTVEGKESIYPLGR